MRELWKRDRVSTTYLSISPNHVQHSPSNPEAPTPLLFFCTLILIFPFFSLRENTCETPEPPSQPWQIQGIIAALDDGYPGVKARNKRLLPTF
jgi:hypothetical protein